ncbi:MAG: FtsX-like permease family protein, partial [Bacteroidota bacterium]
ENVESAQVEARMAELLDQKVPSENQWFTLSLQALGDLHLYSAGIENAYSAKSGDPQQLRLLSFLVIIILLIAAINYMNMSTARSQKKAKEVGINKTVGATRGQLMRQFYTQTGVLVILSFSFSLLLILIFTPIFNRLADKTFSFLDFLQPTFLLGSLAIIFLITLISGAYPALYLSKFSPKALFQNVKTPSKQGGTAWFRKGLVISQFVASVIIIIATLVFFKQLKFTQNKNLGYQPELVVGLLTAGAENTSQINGLINNLRRLPEVETVGRVQTFPGNDGSGRNLTKPNNSEQTLDIQTNRATSEIVDLLGLKLLAGKSLPNRARTNEDTVIQIILNETAVEFLGYSPEEAIGRDAKDLFYRKKSEIVGVVEDFHFESFHKEIGAYAFHNNPSEWQTYTLVKLNTNDLASSMQEMKSAFEQSIPNSAFEYTFIDQYLETLYRTEQKVARIFFIFAVLTILIACLGLFGLTAYTAERRKKEIGIRKVLGASVLNITQLLSIDFLKLVFVAFLLATPIAWYLMRKWLQDFAYHIDLQWWMFILAGGIASIIALLTMSAQSVKAALINPVESLRSE